MSAEVAVLLAVLVPLLVVKWALIVVAVVVVGRRVR